MNKVERILLNNDIARERREAKKAAIEKMLRQKEELASRRLPDKESPQPPQGGSRRLEP